MKIKFLDPGEYDHALLERGIFRKERAGVHWKIRWATDEYGHPIGRWVYSGTGRAVNPWINWRLLHAEDRARSKADRLARMGREWVPLDSLPSAKVVIK
jgi:hypothetical protein